MRLLVRPGPPRDSIEAAVDADGPQSQATGLTASSVHMHSAAQLDAVGASSSGTIINSITAPLDHSFSNCSRDGGDSLRRQQSPLKRGSGNMQHPCTNDTHMRWRIGVLQKVWLLETDGALCVDVHEQP